MTPEDFRALAAQYFAVAGHTFTAFGIYASRHRDQATRQMRRYLLKGGAVVTDETIGLKGEGVRR